MPRYGARLALCLLALAGRTLAQEGEHSLCCTFEIRTPRVAYNQPMPKPGMTHLAARVKSQGCLAADASAEEGDDALGCGADLLTLEPKRTEDFALLLHARMRARCAVDDQAEAQMPVPWRILPPASWLHFAGDTLLRGEFTALTQYLGKRHWERAEGEEVGSREVHKARSLCCPDVTDLRTCRYSSFDEGANETSFATAAREALAAGQSCVTYALMMDYGAVTRSLRALTAGGNSTAAALPTRLVAGAALHTIKHKSEAEYTVELQELLAELAAPAWADTLVALHASTAPDFAAVSAQNDTQTEPAVRAFNAALRAAIAAQPAASRPQLVDYFAATEAPQKRFPHMDALRFYAPLEQSAFVLDNLALNIAACNRRPPAGAPGDSDEQAAPIIVP